jgi:hypothetical protein
MNHNTLGRCFWVNKIKKTAQWQGPRNSKAQTINYWDQCWQLAVGSIKHKYGFRGSNYIHMGESKAWLSICLQCWVWKKINSWSRDLALINIEYTTSNKPKSMFKLSLWPLTPLIIGPGGCNKFWWWVLTQAVNGLGWPMGHVSLRDMSKHSGLVKCPRHC